MRARPGGLRHPAARALLIMRLRRRPFLHPHPVFRFVGDPGVDAFQPLIPPAQGLLEAADGGAGLGDMRIRSDEHTSELQSLMRISYALFCLTKNITTLTISHLLFLLLLSF